MRPAGAESCSTWHPISVPRIQVACGRVKTGFRFIGALFPVSLFWVFTSPATVLYVDVNSPNPTPPFTNWVTAATNLQDAVEAAVGGDLVLVTNGVYATGSANGGSYRVLLTNAVRLASVNGPQATTIQGTNGMWCVYASASGAVLDGFTLTGGRMGGVGCSPGTVVSNCVIFGNTNVGINGGRAYNCLIAHNYSFGNGAGAQSSTLYDCTLSNNVAALDGGGAYGCTLYGCRLMGNRGRSGGGASKGALLNCVLTGNRAGAGGGGYSAGVISNSIVIGNSAGGGGGVADSRVYNCLIVSNSAGSGGGVYIDGGGLFYNCTVCANTATNSGGGIGMYYSGGHATIQNCVIYYNTAKSNANWENFSGGFYDNDYYNCCTTPLPAHGYFNITNPPGLVDWPAGNFRLQTGSPCIDAGDKYQMTMTRDLDGRPRITGATVDIGAYEFQGAGLGEFTGWLQLHGLPTDGSADNTDPDADGLNNWQEWVAGTDPTNPVSVLAMMTPSNNLSGATLKWQSVGGKTYYLQRATNLVSPPGFTALESNILGQADLTSFTDTTATNADHYFYRVGVQ